MMPMMAANTRLCLTVKRNRSDSLPARPTAAQAMAMDWGEIILPVTPPVVLAATVSTGDRPSWLAVVACSAPNKALAEVSEPREEHANPAQEGREEHKRLARVGQRQASVADRPEKATKAKASTMPME